MGNRNFSVKYVSQSVCDMLLNKVLELEIKIYSDTEEITDKHILNALKNEKDIAVLQRMLITCMVSYLS